MNLIATIPLFLILVKAQNPSTCVSDISGLQSRVDCGYYGISEGLCHDRGCCWSPLASDQVGPWCFLPPTPPTCPANVNERTDCGYFGISRSQCLDRGCCWEVSESGPWCFNSLSSTPSISESFTTTTTETTATPSVSSAPTECWAGANGPALTSDRVFYFFIKFDLDRLIVDSMVLDVKDV